MIELLIIADDFTGALDTGAQFAKDGMETYVVEASRFAPDEVPDETQVLVIDAQTRHISPGAAYAAVRSLSEEGTRAQIPYLYIKVDSTLRGNIGAYLSAAIDARGGSARCVLAPALPLLQRTTRNGRQYVGEKPLDETEIMHDPFTPVSSSYLPELLAKQTDIESVLITADRVQKLDVRIPQREIVVVDAQTQQDMRQIAAALIAAPEVIQSGSAGLADELAHCLSVAKRPYIRKYEAHRIFVLSGSLNVHSQRQIQTARQNGMPCIVMDEEQKTSADYVRTARGGSFAEQAAELLRERGILILQTSAWDAGAPTIETENRNHLTVAQNVGAVSAEIIRRSGADTVVVFGGDTLFGLLDALDVSGLRPRCEMLPGIVLSEAEFEGAPLHIISKAGAFGEKDALVKIVRQLTGQVNKQVLTH